MFTTSIDSVYVEAAILQAVTAQEIAILQAAKPGGSPEIFTSTLGPAADVREDE